MGIERTSYLLQNQLNPFPISGVLSLTDDGRLQFTLNEGSAGSFLGWLEKRIGATDLKQRIQAGERPVVFDLPVRQRPVTWPLSLGGYGMKVADVPHPWVITLNYPSGGGIWQIVNMIRAKGTTKPWKAGLAAAGAA